MRWRALECHGRHSTIAMLSGLVVLLALVNVQILTGVRHATWDADGFFAPAQMLVADFAQAGRFLLWNPWTNAGSPDGCDPQYGAFSPICVAFGFLTGGTETGFNLYWLFIWLMGGVGMLFLTRSLDAPPWGCFLASASFMLSGFYTGHASHTSFLHAWSFLPWIIWRWDVSLRARSFLAAAQAGAFWGLSALAGYPGIVVANGGMALAWAIGRIVCSMPPGAVNTDSTAFESDCGPGNRLSHAIFGCAAITLLVATGLVVLSPTYVGFLKETAGFSSRSGPLPRELAVESNALHPAALASLANPHVARHRSAFWAGDDVTSISVYAGAIPVWLAILALVLQPRNRWRWWLVALGLLAIGCAMGRALPIRGWLYDLCPPTRYFRHAAMFRGYLVFVISILASEASRDCSKLIKTLNQRRDGAETCPTKAIRVSAVALVLLAASAYGAMLLAVESIHRSRLLADLHLALCWGGVIWLAFQISSPRRCTPTWPRMALLFVGLDLVLGCFLTQGIMSTRSSRASDQWAMIAAEHSSKLDLPGFARVNDGSFGNSTSNKNLPLKRPILHGYQPLKNSIHEAWASDPVLSELVCAEDRFWFAGRSAVPEIAAHKSNFLAYHEGVHRTGKLSVVIHRPDELATESDEDSSEIAAESIVSQLPAARRIPVDLIEYKPNVLEFSCTVPEPGYLLVTDRWASGWSAMVNGESATVHPGAFIFRVVSLAGGKNHVRLTYRPFGFPQLIILSWMTIGIVVGLTILRARLSAQKRELVK